MKKVKYFMLNPGDEFKLNRVRDNRVFRKEGEGAGALQIKDSEGKIPRHDYMIYINMTSTVWIED